MVNLKKVLATITFVFFILAPLTVEAVQLETVEHSYTWPRVYYQFFGSDWYGTAGEFELILGEDSESFETVGYCVEIDQPIYTPELYDVELEPVTFRPNGLDAAWLMNEYSYGLGNGPVNASVDEMMNAKAALQLAIWDTVYGDNFSVRDATANSIKDLYIGYINGLAEARSSGLISTDLANNFRVAHEDQYQDLLLYSYSAPRAAPEPGTMFLMGCGLIMFVLVIKIKSIKVS